MGCLLLLLYYCGPACDNDEEERFIACNTEEVHAHRFNLIVINSELWKPFIQIIHTHNVILITTKMAGMGNLRRPGYFQV